ncbi:porin [Corynebacterium guangdongense]|uniref:Porin n=1 Tax=Corynebacterium guangdongense TaxID=1783348 RepID=A0ABU1ZZG9_9CORY|nr:porin [Corynebacterium guangdongense]MDR7330322.1 hypothetical protein [Corynebacterium guangdongense]WJZ18880.1 hypothetical protein CGUA_11720 [Corynebacterium guangdongense]
MEFLDNLQTLSSTGIIEWLFDNLEVAGDWADAAVDLAGLL